WATALSRGVRSASERVASVSRGTGKMLQGLAKRAPSERARPSTKPTSVRSTRRLRQEPGPRGDRNARRSQFPNSNRTATSAQAPAAVTVKKSHLVAGGVVTLCIGLGLYSFGAAEPGSGAAAPGNIRALAPVAEGPVTLPTEGVNVQAAAPRRQRLDTEEQLRADTHGMVANVPLFGPTQMATSEPAPEADEPVAAAP